MLNPPPRASKLYDEMVAAGELVPAKDPDMHAWLEPPLPAAPGATPLSEALWQLRDEERY